MRGMLHPRDMARHVPSALEPRRHALALLRAALSRRGGLDAGLDALAFPALEPRDRAFARALALATLRHLGPIDAALAPRLRSPPPEAVRDLLRLGMAQAFFLGTPAFAAVDTTVALAPKPFRGLVNAILRAQLREGPPTVTPMTLAPAWLLARWRATFGDAEASAIAALISAEPATDLALRPDASRDEFALTFDAEPLPTGGLRTRLRGDPAGWPGYADGAWWVQDAAAQIPTRLLAPTLGEAVLDLCAAPGGKTMQLAAAGARVVAVDRSTARLEQLRANLARVRLTAETLAVDALAWADDRRFGAILLDSPCTATGTFRRHPDVLWNARPGDIPALARTQAALLDAAAARLRPGGRLLYSVCSLEREEGEAQVRALLARDSRLAVDPVAAGEGGAPAASRAAEGWLRILPHHFEGGLDGFFIARLRRAS